MFELQTSYDPLSVRVNLCGILLWTALYFALSIHEVPHDVLYLHSIFGVVISYSCVTLWGATPTKALLTWK